MQDATNAASEASSPITSSPLFLHSTPPDGAEGDALMRAADTPLESSPAPTAPTIVLGDKKRKRNVTFSDDEDEDIASRKKRKGRKVGTGKSVSCRTRFVERRF